MAPFATASAIAVSMLLASCGADAEPATATTTITQPNDAPGDTGDDAGSDASRRAKAMQSTGTKSDNDLLRTVDSSAD